MRPVLYVVISFFYLCSIAQEIPLDKHKLGVKTSINISSILGSELQNPRPKFGYTAGAFYIYQTDNKLNLYTELLGNFKGANFSNGDTGYSRIALFYVDLAIMPMYKFNEGKSSVCLGPYTSLLGLSSLFIGDKKKAELNDLDFKNYDIGVAAYYHISRKNMSFQIGTKMGLTNVNEDVNFVGYFPQTGTNGNIRNVSLEIGMLF